MDKRSWLWRRRRSSDKSFAETESSESLSSFSERFSDEQACVNSPELTSKDTSTSTSTAEDELREMVRILGKKLSLAHENIKAKEELVKQHSKVAEEAVLGWENAETNVENLKQKLESANHNSSLLEERVIQLDEALKECLRQLRQAKEEQEQKINEAITKKAIEQYEELEIRTIERDLNAQAAEMASKQHLETVKKVSKLEAECLRLNAIIRKGNIDHNSVTSTDRDSQSNSGERLLALENLTIPNSVEINLMDDFLEMERIAELADKLEKVVKEKTELEMVFAECQDQLKTSNDKLIKTEEKLRELEVELLMAIEAKCIAETKLVAMEEELKKEREDRYQKLQDNLKRSLQIKQVR
ncbi:filament-like plant protein 3 [Impatiens glandulifera]|uniref:filament-like plant protein 3 n=1 Tax=Impatiens glandulifera TaxID=253017 RepID=UPI001FB0B32C|nr:filament-like plant protein 3 [Impatiens glandulifera]